MAREGTRSATGNSKPRVFPVVDTAPTITRKKTTKPKPAAAPATKTKPVAVAKGAKPAGVNKRKATPKTEGVVAKKAKTVTGKVEGKLEKAAKHDGEVMSRGKTQWILHQLVSVRDLWPPPSAVSARFPASSWLTACI
ncbi:hypothetical protein RB599_005078 [Gaeumannomyces hyphopodioides]